MQLFVYGEEEEDTEHMMKPKKETHPCDKKAINWCRRMSILIFSSILLLSMSVVAWSQYSILINEDDGGTPKVMALVNECTNQSWNVKKTEGQYEILYYTYDNPSLFSDTNCRIHIKFPRINLTGDSCCTLVLWNTI